MSKALLRIVTVSISISLFSIWLLSGCSSGVSTTTESTSDPAVRQQDDLTTTPVFPHRAVCSGGTYHCKSRVRTQSDGTTIQSFATAVEGFGPADLASAYALNTSATPGATIAVVDAFGYANAAADLATYRSNFGLPPCTVASGCLTIVNQSGKTSPLPAAPSASDDWTVETALDLDMASSACPNCKLLLVQATDDVSNGLFLAQQAAVNLGATVISNSWGGPDTSKQGPSEETFFNHPGVGEFVASGDQGFDDQASPAADYPATSAFVTAVGGTNLVKSTSAARGWTERAWGPYTAQTGAGGSDCSQDIPKPSYQTNTVCSFRAASDVAAVADPNTGVAVYNNGPSNSGWAVVGGTSAASPFVAGVYALTGHAAAGPSFSYANPTDFNDVTAGSNDSCNSILCKCGTGWDGPTGNGTPNGAALAKSTCTAACSGKACGNDGCGGSCGTCPTGDTCTSSGQCSSTCTPACTGKSCGSDGCSGSCGTCPTGDTCSSAGQCTSGSSCAHPICSTGARLTASCDPCATKICSKDSFCCQDDWDAQCVSEVSSICGESCGTGGTCAHSICSTGSKLTSSCNSCATEICGKDPFCCQSDWDSQCVGEVSSICGESC
jgi:hypothetical protein